MSEKECPNRGEEAVTRRKFLKTSAAAGAATMVTGSIRPAAGKEDADEIRIGLIGCGGRGTGAAKNAIQAAPNVSLVAMGDVFQDRLDKSLKNLRGDEEVAGNIKVTKETCFVGFDAFRKVLECDVDYVILATPPHFRPEHFKAAIEAGKHVFAEKPVATDAFGIRSFIETAARADEKKLCVVAGTQRRHQNHYLEVMKRIHDGEIGRIVSIHAYWNGGTLWSYPRKEGWSDMEYQLRNWYYYTWLCGDHIVEQHVHNLDVANWAIGKTPVKAFGVGGRQVRTDPLFGHIYDHHAVVYEYDDGTLLTSMCRQMKNCKNDVREAIYGTEGVCHSDSSSARIEGKNPGEWGKSPNPYVQEHQDLIHAIRSGEHINEAKRVAESTLTAIMGRMATYTGQEVTWEFAMNSQEKLGPDRYEWGDLPFPEVPMPGKTPLV